MGKPSLKQAGKKSGTSPYHKHGKTPFRYSELYSHWRDAFLKGDRDAAIVAAEKHTRAFGGPELVRNAERARHFAAPEEE